MSNLHSFSLLPVIMILCLVSMRLAFPDVLSRFFSTFFFKNTRAILGWRDVPTLATRLSSSPQFSIACEVIERNTTLWKTLNSEHLSPEAILIIIPDEIVLKNEADRYDFYEKVEHYNYTGMDYFECCNGVLVVNASGDMNVFDYFPHMKGQDGLYSGKFVDFKFFTDYFFFIVFVVYCVFMTIPTVYKLFHKISCGTCVIPFFEDDVMSITSSIRFVFGFFILIPFVGLWQEINRILERLHKMTMIFKAQTVKMLTPKDYSSLTIEQLNDWDTSYAHLQNMCMCKGVFVRYIFMFSVLFSKLFSVVFSVAALFVKFGMNPTIFQLTLLVVVMEIAVMRYIIQPASGATTEMKLIMVQALQKEKVFGKWMELGCGNKSPEEVERLKLIERVMRRIFAQWDFQVISQEVGFSVKSISIQTRWYITAELMRTSIQTFILTVVPSITTYYVKTLLN